MKTFFIPLSIAAALALSLFGMDAIAATPNIDTHPTPRQNRTTSQPTYFIQRLGPHKARKVYYFNRLDRNHDGQLERSEIPRDMRDLRLHFIQADWDDNGRLSPREYVLYKRGEAPQYAGVYHAFVFVY